jgi:hypothetical protein
MRLPLVIAAAAAAAVAASAGAGTTSPRLVIEQPAPLLVHGQHFASGEHVRVTGFARGTTTTRWVTATSTGSFFVRFRYLKAPACAPYGARALGSKGSKATVRVMPECAPGPTP